MGILSGLESLGLEGLEGTKLFEDPEEEVKKAQAAAKAEAAAPLETDFLFDKTIHCPVCETDFKVRAVKSNRARLTGLDIDLRPRYQDVDVTKYEVYSCPLCGYTALIKYFATPFETQKKKIREAICTKYRSTDEFPEIYSYDYSLVRYKLALANAVVKGAKASEIAFICLKTAWIIRGKYESMDPNDEAYNEVKMEETDYIKNAFEGFTKAVSTENFPIAGMDESTVDYLLGALGYMTNHIDVSQRMISKILVSPTANSRMKDRARALKDTILNAQKQ